MKKKHVLTKAVILDMDGVITNTMPAHYRAWKAVMTKYQILISKLDVYLHEGQKGIDFVEEILKREKVCSNKILAQELLAEKERFFSRTVSLQFVRGSLTFLKNLKKKHLDLALVTGTSRNETERMLPDSLKKNFHIIVTGSDVKYGKPDPQPYLIALEKLQVDSKDAIVIENAPLGIQSAKRAGLKCFALMSSLPKEFLREADFIVKSIKDLNEKYEFHKIL